MEERGAGGECVREKERERDNKKERKERKIT